MTKGSVLVVGAGILGSWTASALASRGFEVTLVDQFAPGNARASSGGESRTIRFAHGSDELLTEWSMQSVRHWQELDRGWHEPLQATAGATWLIRDGEDDSWETASASTLARCGAQYRWLDTDEIQSMYGRTAIRGFRRGLHEPDAGLLYARRSVRAIVARCREQGVTVATSHARPGADGRVVLGDGSHIERDHVVWACGPWLGRLFDDVTITALRQHIYYFGGDQLGLDQMPLWLDRTSMVYGSGDLTGRGIKINTDREFVEADLDRDDRLADTATLAWLRRYLSEHFPGLADRPVTGSETNQYEMSVNGDFIIDRLPGATSWWIVGGGSGQGFKHAPMIGAEAANLLAGGAPTTSRFSLQSPRAHSESASVFG